MQKCLRSKVKQETYGNFAPLMRTFYRAKIISFYIETLFWKWKERNRN